MVDANRAGGIHLPLFYLTGKYIINILNAIIEQSQTKSGESYPTLFFSGVALDLLSRRR